MGHHTTIAELQRAGIVIRASEAIAIVQKLINERPIAPPHPPYAPPSPDNVIVDELGNVTCRGCDVKPAVSEIAIFLEEMLPPGTRLSGALRYTMARALLNVDAPPFGSIEELSLALTRFERHDRDHVVRDLVTRARALAGRESHAAIIPFKHSPSTVRVKTERRRPVPAALAAELRRELRRADLDRYARQAASTIPDLRGALAEHKRPIGVVAAGVAAGVLLIASGEVMQVSGEVVEWSLPRVAMPAPQIPEAVSAYPPPSDFFDPSMPNALPPAIVAPAGPLSRQASFAMGDRRLAATRRMHKVRAERTARAARRPSGIGVLSRLRLQWVRGLFTYRRDL